MRPLPRQPAAAAAAATLPRVRSSREQAGAGGGRRGQALTRNRLLGRRFQQHSFGEGAAKAAERASFGGEGLLRAFANSGRTSAPARFLAASASRAHRMVVGALPWSGARSSAGGGGGGTDGRPPASFMWQAASAAAAAAPGSGWQSPQAKAMTAMLTIDTKGRQLDRTGAASDTCAPPSPGSPSPQNGHRPAPMAAALCRRCAGG